jgi:hypothetical protein
MDRSLETPFATPIFQARPVKDPGTLADLNVSNPDARTKDLAHLLIK